MKIFLEKAARFAGEKHGDQRYGSYPYITHLIHVVDTLKRYGELDPDILAAGYLHDVLEDTDCTPEELRREFNDRIVELVEAVTKEDGGSRKERAQKTYPKIAATPGALRLKLADRIANVESCRLRAEHSLYQMYKTEHADFKKALKNGEYPEMWDHLDALLHLREHADQPLEAGHGADQPSKRESV